MEVCGLCGAMLVKNDTEERTRSHFSGKQHLGFEKIRKTIEEFQVCSFFFGEEFMHRFLGFGFFFFFFFFGSPLFFFSPFRF